MESSSGVHLMGIVVVETFSYCCSGLVNYYVGIGYGRAYSVVLRWKGSV